MRPQKPAAKPAKKRARRTGVAVQYRPAFGTWRVRWRDDGKHRSLSFDSRAAADAEATALRDKLREDGRAGLRGVDAAALAELALIHKALGGATVAQLLLVWERHKAEVLGANAGLTVFVAIEKFLAIITEEGLAGANYDRYEKHLFRLRASFAKTPLVAISDAEIRRWLANLHTERGGKATGWTLIHHYKTLATFFARATAQKWIATDPMLLVRPPEKPVEEVAFLSVDDGHKLFHKNKDHPVSLLLALEAFCGLRFTGAVRLSRAEVDIASRTIRIPATKSKDGKRHLLDALPANAWAWIEKWHADPQPWEMTQRQYLYEKGLAFERAGVVNSGNVLRHSFCSYHVALGKDAALTAVLMQHTNPAMLYRHYRGAASAVEAERWFALTPATVEKQVEPAVR